MGRHYHDERRAKERGYLPNLVTEHWHEGWYYHFAMPGCMPDSEAEGPFESEEEALEHARLDLEDEDFDPTDSQIADYERRSML